MGRWPCPAWCAHHTSSSSSSRLSRSNMRCNRRLWRIRIGRCPWKCPMVLTGGHGHEQVHPWSYSKVLTGEYGCSSGIVHNIIIEASVRLDYSPHYYIGQQQSRLASITMLVFFGCLANQGDGTTVRPLPSCPARFVNVQRVSQAPLSSSLTMAARLSRGGWRQPVCQRPTRLYEPWRMAAALCTPS